MTKNQPTEKEREEKRRPRERERENNRLTQQHDMDARIAQRAINYIIELLASTIDTGGDHR